MVRLLLAAQLAYGQHTLTVPPPAALPAAHLYFRPVLPDKDYGTVVCAVKVRIRLFPAHRGSWGNLG